MLLTDFHTHAFPQKIAKQAIASLEKSSGTKAFTDGTINGLINSMQNAKIDRCVLLPIAVKAGTTQIINEIAKENNKLASIISFGSVHPDYENCKEELVMLKESGIKGIKLHPDFQGCFIDDPKMVEIMAIARDLGLITVIHGGEDVSFPKIHRSTPKRLYSVLDQLKGAKIVVAHSGGCNYEEDFIKYLLGRDEIYIDTSYSIGKADNEILKTIYENMDSSHILFGTDSPWDSQENTLKAFLNFDISQEIKNKALYENAQTLLK